MSSTADDELKQEHDDDDDGKIRSVDPHVDRPHQSRLPACKRAALVTLLVVLLSLAVYLGPATKPGPKIIHASRYSKEFKYRPAASPVITEHLKDGRIRLRGALPTQ